MSQVQPAASLRQSILDLVSKNGGSIGNASLRLQIESLLSTAFVEADFEIAKDALIAEGALIKGKGRGGSVRLPDTSVVTADDDALVAGDEGAVTEIDEFSLLMQEGAPTVNTAPKKPKAPAVPKASTLSASATREAQVLSYRHSDRRKNNPEVGLVSEVSDPQQPRKVWAFDPHLDPVLNFDSARAELETLVDNALASGNEATMHAALLEIKRRGAPYLQWTGKSERTSFEVDTVSLHVHERIDPMSILSAVRKRLQDEKKPAGLSKANTTQASLFEAPFEALPLRDAIDFYKHDKGWANRLIAGDSLQVMNSLLVKESMAGQVQMIYIDPPYGIKYGSNFQPFVRKEKGSATKVEDRKDSDLTQEPEMIKAFRDTWEIGVHSYLTYLRDRLKLSRELLSDSGSVFIQISDENLHHIKEVLDEVFGSDNYLNVIPFNKTSGVTTKFLASNCDFLVWYAKDKTKAKYHQIYKEKSREAGSADTYSWLDSSDFPRRGLTAKERRGETPLPTNARLYKPDNITSQGNPIVPFEHQNKIYEQAWKTDKEGVGLRHLARANRLHVAANSLQYVRLLSDFAYIPVTQLWDDMQTGSFTEDKTYVVQTAEKVIERCVLMTTDPGDLVLDPTCGSGTAAFVAEKWGRRWITCDTSRVAITLAKQRLMTASYDYYELAYPHEGLKGGFLYKTVPHITLKSIANNVEIDAIYERMHPAIDAALGALNDALLATPPLTPLVVGTGARKGEKLKLGHKSVELLEWEVPFPTESGALPPGWPDALRTPFDAFHAARKKMQAEMDRSIDVNADSETLYDRPTRSDDKLRITGPFTVEAVPFPTVLSLEAAEGGAEAAPSEDQAYQTSIARSGETSRQQQWRDELIKTGIRGKGGQMLRFAELEVLAGTTCLHASGTLTDTGERVVVSFGPEHGALEQRQVEHALGEAGDLFPRPKMIVFCAFTFDPEAAKDIDAVKGIMALKAQMNTDLLTEDLKRARSSNQSFWLMGQPDVEPRALPDGKWQIEVNGFDYFDTVKGELVSGGKAKIAMWSLDIDYDGRSLFPHQVFFPMAGKDDGWRRLKKDIRAELDESLLGQFHGTVSLPFEAGPNAKAAVKIVDDRGIESLKIVPLVAPKV